MMEKLLAVRRRGMVEGFNTHGSHRAHWIRAFTDSRDSLSEVSSHLTPSIVDQNQSGKDFFGQFARRLYDGQVRFPKHV